MNDGVEAIAQGLKDGGVEAVYNFPGFYSHDLAAALGESRISLSERTAFAEAFGSALAGKRTLVAFKNVGLNVASDAFLHAITAGVRAGLVLVVTDDIAVWGSQESQDSRHYFDFYGGLWLEPKDLQQAYDYARDAFELSEQLDVPIVIRLANDYFTQKSSFNTKGQKEIPKSFVQIKPEKFVVHPYFFESKEKSLVRRKENIAKWVKGEVILPKQQSQTGVIIVGAANCSLKDSDVLRITTLPLPEEAITAFVNGHEDLQIVEDGDGYVAEKVRALMSKAKITSIVPKDRGTKTTFTKWDRHETFFKALSEVKANSLVVGEIAQFTVETYDTVDVSLSLGTAVSTAIGYAEAKSSFTFCISGDCSFLHEGIGIIDEALKRDVKLGLVIFDNHASWCTGGQHPAGDIDQVVNPKVKKFYLNYKEVEFGEIVETLKSMRGFDGVSILYLKIPLGKLTRD